MEKNSTRFLFHPFVPGVDKDLTSDRMKEAHDFPSGAVISNILNFSKALRVKKSNSLGKVELVLN